jgi:ribose transport system permease protein
MNTTATLASKSALQQGGAGAPMKPGANRFKMDGLRDYGIVFATLVLFILLALSSDVFLTRLNLGNVVDQWAPIGLMACAGTLVILVGGFDLSVGSIFAVSAVSAALVANSHGSATGIAVGITAGGVLGLFNGVLTTTFRINHFVATIASAIVFKGFATVLSGGFLVAVSDSTFQRLGTDKIFGFNYSVYILVAFALICGFILNWMTIGRHIRATGANIEAALLSGISTNRVIIFTYVLSGLAAGLAAALVASRTGAAQPNMNAGIESSVWAAILVGGTSLVGGRGAIWRTVLGVLLLAMIGNGFNLLGLDTLYQQILTGVIILLAVGLDALARRRSR